MTDPFVPYQESIDMKDLKFDYPCIKGFYNGEDIFANVPSPIDFNRKSQSGELVSSPSYQQAFDFFRTKYGLYHIISPEFYIDGINFNWQIRWYLPKEEWTKNNIMDGTFWYGDNNEYPTPEKAEQDCLIELIKIAKNKKP